MSSDVVEDPVSRLRFGFDRRGDVLHVDVWAEPGAQVAEHVHPPAEERFHVLEGDVLFRVDGRDVPAGSGARVTVPAGVRHAFSNPGPGAARFAVELEPDLGFEPFFRDSAALARSGAFSKAGRPRGWSGLLAS
ncbi:MAG TPA: cupin domain-containing protein, partial [Solirubrobacteraceae bacterium]|nr:cupin domain-containing protein [Solirubrobacteraceae bacterium]